MRAPRPTLPDPFDRAHHDLLDLRRCQYTLEALQHAIGRLLVTRAPPADGQYVRLARQSARFDLLRQCRHDVEPAGLGGEQPRPLEGLIRSAIGHELTLGQRNWREAVVGLLGRR